jgi:nitrate reductase alpha subunit
VKNTSNPLWEEGFRFYLSTPKSRHSVHSSWSVVDWNWIWSDNFGDPYRKDKRLPGVADRQIQMNPEAAKEQGLNDGDYIYVDANPDDRPYIGFDEDSRRYDVSRCMVRVKFNPALPKHFTIMKHTGWMATEGTVDAQENREDGRALSESGYQASYRSGSHQSCTRNWMMPMHQTDHLFHKATTHMGFVFGFNIDNHAINTVPKETLVRVEKAEDGGKGGEGSWEPSESGYAPSNEDEWGERYLDGSLTQVEES